MIAQKSIPPPTLVGSSGYTDTAVRSEAKRPPIENQRADHPELLSGKQPRTVLTATIAATVAVLLVQVSVAQLQFSTGDEGWLWYGMQRTIAGEWPLRDFNSYDPGRYFFLAAWAQLWHSDRIVVMRYGLAVVQWLALFPAVLLIARTIRLNLFAMTLLACTLALWMAPRHKIFDIAATVWMTAALAALISQPSRWRYRWAGLLTGLLWLIGRNHLLYGSLGLLLACVWIGFKSRPFRSGWQLVWCAQGFVLGLLPMLILLCAVKGYATAYWQNAVLRLFEIGSTNLPLPVPWPWEMSVDWSNFKSIEHAAVGLGFVLLPTVSLLTMILCIARKHRSSMTKDAVLISAAITALAWAHQGFSRADLSHLAQASLPLGILLLTVPGSLTKRFRAVAMLLCYGSFAAITFLAMLQLSPFSQSILQPDQPFHWQDVNGETLYIPDTVAGELQLARAVANRAGTRERVLFAPYFPGLYAALRLRCPIFDAYPLYPKTASQQQQSIAALGQSNTTWAVIWPYRMDGRPELGFDKTDPDVWNFIRDTSLTEQNDLPPTNAQVFRKRSLDDGDTALHDPSALATPHLPK